MALCFPHGALRVEHGTRQHPPIVRIGKEAFDRIPKVLSDMLFVRFIDESPKQFFREILFERRKSPVSGLNDRLSVHQADVLLFKFRRGLPDPSGDGAGREIISVVDPHLKPKRPAGLSRIPDHLKESLAEIFFSGEAALRLIEQDDPAKALFLQMRQGLAKCINSQFVRIVRRDKIERDRAEGIYLFFAQRIFHVFIVAEPRLKMYSRTMEFHENYLPLYLVGNSCYTAGIF